jgi:hypothetical protein
MLIRGFLHSNAVESKGLTAREEHLRKCEG